LAERLAEPPFLADHEDTRCHSINPAWLNALGLRYYLVKLIRLVAYFTEVRPLRTEQSLQLVVATSRLVEAARTKADIIIVDTSGVVSGVTGETLKYHKLELCRPDVVIGLQRGGELEPLVGMLRRFFPLPKRNILVESFKDF